MYFLWRKLHRPWPAVRKQSMVFKGISEKIDIAMEELKKAQRDLMHDIFNLQLIDRTKELTSKVINLNNIKE